MLKPRLIALGLIVSLSCVPLLAQKTADKDLLERIRKEEATNSQIMKTEHMLADVYGPRLTGSPNHKGAAEWAIKQMSAWGLQNAHLGTSRQSLCGAGGAVISSTPLSMASLLKAPSCRGSAPSIS